MPSVLSLQMLLAGLRAGTGSCGSSSLGNVWGMSLSTPLTTSSHLPHVLAPGYVPAHDCAELPPGAAGGAIHRRRHEGTGSERGTGTPGGEGGCGGTSASSLSESSSTFTVRMKARCARTWRSASRRYFLQAHGGQRGWQSVTQHCWAGAKPLLPKNTCPTLRCPSARVCPPGAALARSGWGQLSESRGSGFSPTNLCAPGPTEAPAQRLAQDS